MAGNLGFLAVFLKLDDRDYSKGLKNSSKKMSGWKKATIAGVAAVGAAIVSLGVASVRAFGEQEKVEKQLASAIANTGDSVEDNLAKLKDYASAIQKTTTFGDEAVLSAMAYGKNLGIMTDQLDEAATAAVGLSAKLGIDLRTTMMLLGRASKGQTQMLTRYGLTLDAASSPQEKFNQLLKIGADNFTLAEAEAATNTGAIKQMSNSWGDMLEKIGEFISKSVGLKAIFISLRDAFNSLGSSIEKHGKTFGRFFDSIVVGTIDIARKIRQFDQWLQEVISQLVRGMWNSFKGFFKDITANFKNLGKSIWGFLKDPFSGFNFKITSENIKRAFSQIEIPPLVFGDFTGQMQKVASVIQKKTQIGAVKTAKVITGGPAKSEQTIVKAVERGSLEALRIQSKRGAKEDKIEKNTKKTADGITEMVDIMTKFFPAGGMEDRAVIKGVFA